MERGYRNGKVILGDSIYKIRKWQLTPFIQPANDAQDLYNGAHTRTRTNCLEQMFGLFKRLFALMHQEVGTTPKRACKLFSACSVLHNKAKDCGLPYVQL